MEVTARPATPWHLWVVGLLALLFTAYGAYDYLMTQVGNIAYISAASEPWGMDPQAAMAYFDSFPVWADAIWAVGVWSGVAGALLLLARSRYAYPVLILSLAGLVISNLYALANPMPGLADPTPTYIVTGVIFLIMLGFTLYARRMTVAGVLR